MLTKAIYLNTVFIFILSILILIKVIKNKGNIEKNRPFMFIYLIFDVINIYFLVNEIVNVSIECLLFEALSLLSIILLFISYIISKNKTSKSNKDNQVKIIYILIVIQSLLFIVPYLYELYVLNNCEYLATFDYNEMFDRPQHIAILNKKPVEIDLTKNLINRNYKELDADYIQVSYVDGLTFDDKSDSNIVEKDEENLEKIAKDALEKSPTAKGAQITYINEGKLIIIELTSEEKYGLVVGSYLYYDYEYSTTIDTDGDLDTIIYYEN